MKKYVEGNYDDVTDPENFVPLEAIIEEVKLEAAKGVTEKIILIIPNLWGDGEKDLRERITRNGGPTVGLLNYGYRTGLDSFLHERFRQKFMVTRHTVPSNYMTMKCTSCNSPTSVVPVSIAESYTSLRKKFECGACRTKEAASRAIRFFSNLCLAEFYQSPTSHVLFDSFGRLRDQ